MKQIPRLAALARNDKVAMFRMVVEVLAWGVVVGAGGFVVAAANGGMKCVAFVIAVECEAAGAFVFGALADGEYAVEEVVEFL